MPFQALLEYEYYSVLDRRFGPIWPSQSVNSCRHEIVRRMAIFAVFPLWHKTQDILHYDYMTSQPLLACAAYSIIVVRLPNDSCKNNLDG